MKRARLAPVAAAFLGLLVAACGEENITETSFENTLVGPSFLMLSVETETGLSEHDLSGLTDATDFTTAGVGTESNNAETISVEVPSGATIEKVYLYWARRILNPNDAPASEIKVGGTTVTATSVFGPIETSDNLNTPTVYLANITGEGVISDGTTNFTVEDEAGGALGASVLVFFDDGTGTSEMSLWDGVDFVWASDGATVRQVAEPVTHTFASASAERTAELVLFVGDVGGASRPNELDITIGSTTTTIGDDESDPFFDADGPQWDNFVMDLTIPAGVTEVTVEPISPADESNPASIVWAATALSIEPLTGGGEGCTPGYWRQEQHVDEWTAPHDPTDLFTDPGFNLPSELDRPEQNVDPTTVTLLGALELRGSGVNALMRHAVAALLNAASPDVDYDLNESQVVDAFNLALAGTESDIEAQKDEFETFNEQGCPLD